MFGEECTLLMDIGLPRQQPDPLEGISSPYAVWVKDARRWRLIKSVDTRARLYSDRRDFMSASGSALVCDW